MLKRLSKSVAARYSSRSMIALLLGAAFFAWLFNFSKVPFSNQGMKRIWVMTLAAPGFLAISTLLVIVKHHCAFRQPLNDE